MRPNTTATVHQDSTGICASRIVRLRSRITPASRSMRVKLWITGTLPSTSDARSASEVLCSSTLPCSASVRRRTNVAAMPDIITSAASIAPSRQFSQSDSGSTTTSDRIADRFSRKKER